MLGAVIVNYNSARLALDAALSVLGDEPQARVVIVDNASTDDSIAYFESTFSDRRHDSAVPCDTVCFASIEALGTAIIGRGGKSNAALTVLCSNANSGFAAGCNIGLAFLKEAFDPAVYLLLNPDAVVAQGSLQAFARKLARKNAGLCGASILQFEAPHKAQAFGGAKLHPMTLLGENIGAGISLNDAPDVAPVESQMSYPLGAAMTFRRDYFEKVGPLDERFFLYYEEADWAARGARAGFQPVWAPEAVVFHRHGAAAGSRLPQGGRSVLADHHMARSRMLFALKWRPLLVPFLLVLAAGQSFRRALRGEWRQAAALLNGAVLSWGKTS